MDKKDITNTLKITMALGNDNGNYLRFDLNEKQAQAVRDALGMEVYVLENNEYDVHMYKELLDA